MPGLVVTIIVLAVSIVGIPPLVLVPSGILFAVLAMVVGFVAMAHR